MGGGGGGEHIGARTAYAGEEALRKSLCAAAPGGVYPYHIVNYIIYSTKILISFERKYKARAYIRNFDCEPLVRCDTKKVNADALVSVP
jgi:hypothetical protein